MKASLIVILIVALLLSMVGCISNAPATDPTDTDPTDTTPGETTPQGGYALDAATGECIVNDGGTVTATNEGNARVYYQIFVGSFSDSNGDGIGDLRGIINRFDYLNDGKENSGLSLGVEGIWLSPIFKSPTYHKYDVTDYYKIDPQFGTEADLRELIDLCHSRGVQLIIDLVLNHTAKNHQWFQAFVNAHAMSDKESMYYDYYTYADALQPGRTFTKIPGTNEYYECNFSTEMPELNFDNPNVRQEVVDIAAYYLELGIDGFRFDAAKYIYFGENQRSAEFWDWYLAELRKIKPDVYTVAEVWDGDGVVQEYYTSTNCFNFTMSQTSGTIAQAAITGSPDAMMKYVQAYTEAIKAIRSDAMLCSFIANHDTDRAAGFLPMMNGRAIVGANLNILTPGSPFIYYGEEIGMKGSRGGANTDANRRLAMLWGDGDTVKDPEGTTYKADSQTNGTVADQKGDADSLYNHYKKLIQIRKANPEIAYGDFKALEIDGKLGGFLSTWNGSSVAVIHNTSDGDLQVDISSISDIAAMQLSACAGRGEATLEGTLLTIPAQTSVVLR